MHHCCHDECDCQNREFELDLVELEEFAIERGVALPVVWSLKYHIPMSDAAPDEVKSSLRQEGAFVSGLAEHYADEGGWGPVSHHRITLATGRTAAETIQDALHEVEHCVQAEHFETARGWHDAYAEHYEDWEAWAILAEDDWEAYGHILQPRGE